MKSDMQLKADITSELGWDPAIHATRIGVAVNDGVVTLTGHLDSFAEKHAVETAVRRVSGVRGIAIEIEVELGEGHQRGDSEIAKAAIDALRWHSLVPDERVTVEVEKGWVTLSGAVDWRYQLTSAEQCVHPLMGVRGVTNNITLKQHVNKTDISAEISAALTRHAQREANRIDVDVEGAVVTLAGDVQSLAERDAALGAAWSKRGVGRVVDKLQVQA